MAPYLFFLGVGTYTTYRRWLEYPDGDSFLLELLLFPGLVKDAYARVAMDSLHDNVMWVYTSCGPEAAEHVAEREEVNRLLAEREAIKARAGPLTTVAGEAAVPATALSAEDAVRLAVVRSRLRELIGGWGVTGYKYSGQIYREIAMENSDYGGCVLARVRMYVFVHHALPLND